MGYSIIFLITITLLSISSNSLGWLSSEDDKNNAELELLKKIEIERIKAHIMEELGLTEMPVASKSSERLPDGVIQLLLAEGVPPVERQKQLARLLIFPSNDDFHCKTFNSSSCRRFEYNIAQGAMFYTTEFWFLKQLSLMFENQSISVLCSHPDEGHEKIIEIDDIAEENNKWVSIHLPMLEQLEFWKGNLICAIEVTGIVINEEEHNLPFLKIKRDLYSHTRKKRSEESIDLSQTCKPISFNVSFDEIGFGEHIFQPESYTANLCRGYCLEAQTMHETVVDLAFQRSSSLEREHGRCWSTCCRPKTYEDLRILHYENDNGTKVFVDTYVKSMIVTSCWCS